MIVDSIKRANSVEGRDREGDGDDQGPEGTRGPADTAAADHNPFNEAGVIRRST
jgi:hypothetical protein